MANAKPKRVLYVLGSDPGTANHGVGVVKAEVHAESIKFQVLGNSRIDRLFLPQNFKDPYADQQKYVKALDKFFKSCVPKHVKAPSMLVIERFQGRGLRGAQGELVSFMLGSQIAKWGSTAPIEILTAGTWKNQVNRVEAKKGQHKKDKLLERMYEANKAHGTNHQLDACLMSIYGVCKLFDMPYYTMLKAGVGRIRFLGEIKRTAK